MIFYLEEFFEKHKSDLQSGYWRNTSVEDAIFDTIDFAQDFEDLLFELSLENESNQKNGLESIFSPLSNSHYKVGTLGKYFCTTRRFYKKWRHQSEEDKK